MMKSRCPNPNLDADISVLHALMRPGERLDSRTIADIVGCSHTLIYLIEKKALRKVREAMRRKLQADYGQFAQEKVSNYL